MKLPIASGFCELSAMGRRGGRGFVSRSTFSFEGRFCQGAEESEGERPFSAGVACQEVAFPSHGRATCSLTHTSPRAPCRTEGRWPHVVDGGTARCPAGDNKRALVLSLCLSGSETIEGLFGSELIPAAVGSDTPGRFGLDGEILKALALLSNNRAGEEEGELLRRHH
jgi:hypothetical protein